MNFVIFYSFKYEIFFVGKYLIFQYLSRYQKREIENLTQISHPFLPKFYGILEYFQNNMIVIEFINGCTLKDFINSDVDDAKRMKTIIEIMIVLEYLHDHKFIYRDLKPTNIMIDSNGTVVFIDFDHMIKSNDMTTRTYTFSIYSAPDKEYKIKSEIYSLGLVIYFILAGRNPENNQAEDKEINFEDIPDKFEKISIFVTNVQE